MNIDITTPEINLLLREVEKKSSITPRLVSDFEALAHCISNAGERLSQSTLERVWQYSTRRKPTVSEHTLNVLSRFAGYRDWSTFCQWVKANSHPDSGYFTDGILDVDALKVGDHVVLTWLPNRRLVVEYRGARHFCVTESHNSSIQVGDTFECTQIQKGVPLYLDRFCRPGDMVDGRNARYVVGRDSGILSVEVVDNEAKK